MADQATKSYLEATKSEKKEMQSLNERLGNYIGRVSGLEGRLLQFWRLYWTTSIFLARNRQLADDLENVRSKWGSETNEIKIKHSADLTDARKVRRGPTAVSYRNLARTWTTRGAARQSWKPRSAAWRMSFASSARSENQSISNRASNQSINWLINRWNREALGPKMPADTGYVHLIIINNLSVILRSVIKKEQEKASSWNL